MLTSGMIAALETSMLKEFVSLVATNAEYDIKNNDNTPFSNRNLAGIEPSYNGQVFRVDDFGNYNFGVAAKAMGISLTFSQIGAGIYQIYSETSNWNWGASYFDDPRDNFMIKEGYEHF